MRGRDSDNLQMYVDHRDSDTLRMFESRGKVGMRSGVDFPSHADEELETYRDTTKIMEWHTNEQRRLGDYREC